MVTSVHLYVHPITGPDAGRRKCYICAYGGDPFIAVFIRPDSPRRMDFIEDVEKLSASQKGLGAIVIFLTSKSDEVVTAINAREKISPFSIVIAMLDPELGLNSLPVDPRIEITVLLFRSRMITQKLEKGTGETFFDRFVRDSPNTFKQVAATAPQSFANTSAETDATEDAEVHRIPMYTEIRQAAHEMMAVK